MVPGTGVPENAPRGRYGARRAVGGERDERDLSLTIGAISANLVLSNLSLRFSHLLFLIDW